VENVESKKTIPVGPLSRGIASGKVQPAKHSVLIGDYGAVMQTCARNYRQARSEGSLEKMQTELNNLMLYQRVRDDEELEMLILGEKPHESRLEKLVRPGSRVRTIEKAADAIFILSGLGTAIDYFANNGQHALISWSHSLFQVHIWKAAGWQKRRTRSTWPGTRKAQKKAKGKILMEEVYFATTNKGKFTYLSQRFGEFGLKLSHAQMELPEPRSEDLKIIAKEKVLHAYRQLGRPCIAVDAGFMSTASTDSQRHLPTSRFQQ
jgi:hypothetical protein